MNDEAVQTVIRTARDLALQLIDGDLRLRGLSLDVLPIQPWLPTVLVSKSIQGTISLVWDVESSQLLFFKREAWSPLEFQMNLKLRPVGGDIPFSSAGMAFSTPPLFKNPGQGEPLVISLEPSGSLWLRTDAKKGPLGAFWVDETRPPPQRFFVEPKDWSSVQVVGLLRAFQSWVRGGGARAEFASTSASPGAGRLDWLFNAIQKGYDTVIRVAQFEFSEQDLTEDSTPLRELERRNRSLRAIHPDLTGDYSAQVFSQISVWLAEDGTIASDMKKAIKVDLGIEAVPLGTTSRLRVVPNLPDFQVAGPLHDKIAEAVREKARAFSRNVRSVPGLDRRQLEAHFRSEKLSSALSILRLQRLPNDEDWEALLFEHDFNQEKAWFLFTAKVKDFSGERPRLDDLGWEAAALGSSFFVPGGERRKEFDGYLRRIAGALLTWQSKASGGHSV